ncbi:hypothetical protein MHBO_000405 [Bonamia ostreae]|uniref:ADP,ATP carrier protein n=1 Tax=Bonamia ostreae TaxID=126728 RepID=A0ABV2AFJ6_9EUKA
MFFPLIDITESALLIKLMSEYPKTASFFAGNIAGIAISVINNLTNTIRYKSWSSRKDISFTKTAVDMWKKGRIRPFFDGVSDLIMRDLIFGGVFALARKSLYSEFIEKRTKQPQTLNLFYKKLALNFIAGAAATIISSPFNYCKNVKYWTEPGEKAPSSTRILYDLFFERKTLSHLENRLQFFWGTLRVSMGIGLAAVIYDYILSKK